MLFAGTPWGYESLAGDVSYLNQHVMEGVGDLVEDANQLGQHPHLHHRLQRLLSNPRAGLSNQLVNVVHHNAPSPVNSSVKGSAARPRHPDNISTSSPWMECRGLEGAQSIITSFYSEQSFQISFQLCFFLRNLVASGDVDYTSCTLPFYSFSGV